jgi:hypothetical protein
MFMHFDAKRFDSLQGFDLAEYTMGFLQERIAGDEILPYFDARASSMDMEHLESAIALLGRVGSDAAYNRVGDYLEHSNFSVRAVATGVLVKADAVDEVVMRRVTESLLKDEGVRTALSQQLRVLLDRPKNAAARRVASEYRNKLGTKEV